MIYSDTSELDLPVSIWVRERVHSPDANFLYDQPTLSRLTDEYIFISSSQFLNFGPFDRQLDTYTTRTLSVFLFTVTNIVYIVILGIMYDRFFFVNGFFAVGHFAVRKNVSFG